MNEDEITHLKWILDRLQYVYGENPNFDYMIKLSRIINKMERRRIMKDAIMPELIELLKKCY